VEDPTKVRHFIQINPTDSPEAILQLVMSALELQFDIKISFEEVPPVRPVSPNTKRFRLETKP